ncbi:uncharacterized protein LOC142230182 [Haematobia irritans]|uniref:uncharacterized protein LOC142230182 n=1 Tax=Haematobia irritans TaxID=7368 RepID=UPI003F50CED3
MGRSSSKPLPKPNNPLQEIQFKESQRERSRQQHEKQRKQIARLQKKQAKKQRKLQKKNKRNSNYGTSASNCHPAKDCNSMSQPIIRLRGSDETSPSGSDIRLRYDFRREEFNRQLEAKIQKELNENLCEFILNQCVFTMQFFKNCESELSTISDEILANEKELNQNLEEHSIILANPLDVAVAKWINYKPVHGPDKHNPQLLQPQTIYMVFENIDIARPNDANYDSISPLCKVDMEMDFRESTPYKEEYGQLLNDIKWKGYVRLRLREDSNDAKSLPPHDDDIYSEGSSGYGTTSPYGSKKSLNNSAAVVLGKSEESDYDYAFITHLNTQHPLKELRMTNGRDRQRIEDKVLPDSCISALGNFVQPLQDEEFTDDEEEEEDSENDYDDDREEDYRDYDTLQAIKQYRLELEKRRKLLAQCYLDSKEFMRYFGELVRKRLADQLKISGKELDMATFRGSSIYTNHFELIPAIYVAQNVTEWPKCAFEFRLRHRPMSTNPQTGQQSQWPTRAMIKRIETFGFHVVPLGYAPKKQRNPFRDIEWRIVFPKAERYLEQHLTNAQIKVFMITKALLKSFVEPCEKNKSLMFALDHLRSHLFWECERDYNAWPEEFLGEVLLRFIESFKQRVREKHLSDFFIRERNLFESIPEYSLNTLYTILADITANPLMHLMIAFRNLDCPQTYFPKLNFKKIFENLVENDMLKLKLLAKNARSLMDLVEGEDEERCLMPDEGAKGLVGMSRHHVRTNGKLRRKTQLLRHNIEMKKKEMVAKRRSVESIDVEFFFQRDMNNANSRLINQGVENLRRTNILEIFIDHLLAMSAKALEFHSAAVMKSYLSQSRRLCKFYHNYGCDIGAKEYLSKIQSLDEELEMLYVKEDFSYPAPSLPVRISIEPTTQSRPCNVSDPMEMVIKEEVKVTPKQPCHLYEEMVLQEPMAINEPRKTNFKIRTTTLEEDTQSKSYSDTNAPINNETNLQTPKSALKKSFEECDSRPFSEPRKSIKFNNVVVKVKKGDTNPIQKPQCYSPVSILRSKQDRSNDDEGENDEDYSTDSESEDQQPPTTPTSNPSTKPSSSLLPSLMKSSSDFIKSSPLGNTEMFQSISHSTDKIFSNLSTDERKAQIRDMLKRKTLQLKGVFNQSSDS